jgi:hypothetical protein
VSEKVVQENVLSLYQFFIKSFVPTTYSWVGLVICLAIGMYVVWEIKVFVKKRKLSQSKQFIFLWFFWGYIAVFVHGSPPIHYFVPLLPIPILLLSMVFDTFFQKRIAYIVLSLFLLALLSINIHYFFSQSWYFLEQNKVTLQPYYNPYVLQVKVARYIIRDAHNKLYTLRRVGIDDQFEDDYAQNYIYLLWLYGNEPVKRAKLRYTIFEGVEQNQQGEKIGNITIRRDTL